MIVFNVLLAQIIWKNDSYIVGTIYRTKFRNTSGKLTWIKNKRMRKG